MGLVLENPTRIRLEVNFLESCKLLSRQKLSFFSTMPTKSEKLPTMNTLSVNIYCQSHINFQKLKLHTKVGKVADHLVGGWRTLTALRRYEKRSIKFIY